MLVLMVQKYSFTHNLGDKVQGRTIEVTQHHDSYGSSSPMADGGVRLGPSEILHKKTFEGLEWGNCSE